MSSLAEFVRESNRIEGIRREPYPEELAAHESLMEQPGTVNRKVLCQFVDDICGAELREHIGMDVRVGSHFPPPGGPAIREALDKLMALINGEEVTPYRAHVAYEMLHPFMDGNGRSGRALWAWQMQRDGLDPFALPFLHRFYYQALDASGDRA